MFSKFEAIGIGISVLFMALALYLLRLEGAFVGSSEQTAAVSEPSIVFIDEQGDGQRAVVDALTQAADERGRLRDLVVDDVVIGTGEPVIEGDTVTVHYVGRLQNGQEFDNSRDRGEPFTFTVGSGAVIAGWEEGVIGMREGGERILVIPPRLAYGEEGYGPIPANATLVFAVELLEID